MVTREIDRRHAPDTTQGPAPMTGAAGPMEILAEAFNGRIGCDGWLEVLIDRVEAQP